MFALVDMIEWNVDKVGPYNDLVSGVYVSKKANLELKKKKFGKRMSHVKRSCVSGFLFVFYVNI